MLPSQQQPITVDQVIGLHAKAMRMRGQDDFPVGRHVRDCVAAKIGSANIADQISAANSQIAQAGLAFAGHALFYLVKGHCFVDGNKRIGWIVAIEVLRRKGLEIDSPDQEVIDFVLKIASNEVPDGLAVVKWLADRIVSIQSDHDATR